jgi:hypothetical protein
MIEFDEDKPTIENTLIDGDLSPIEKVIKDDNFNKLSHEAKTLAWIILNSPQEIIASMPKGKYRSDQITKKKCQLYLRKKLKDPFILTLIIENFVKSIIDELTNWANEL